ncbi:hypothetical protein SCHPADRAFT_12000 [Schizopora paradoxa]|uniref:Secreted protein n=1 Tax=Schizopora paradoxa TaxID=27342 RepID=A0A0H2S8J9_9AGAM|nr:hypothetical protein SCHPADRAFT_12000 [Schizopora paradoxa]
MPVIIRLFVHMIPLSLFFSLCRGENDGQAPMPAPARRGREALATRIDGVSHPSASCSLPSTWMMPMSDPTRKVSAIDAPQARFLMFSPMSGCLSLFDA